MILSEKHIINKENSYYKECDNLCFLSKNLYNQGLYNVRQYYFENKKYLTYQSNYHLSKVNDSYSKLPAKVACQTLMLVDQNFKSFFGLFKVEPTIAKIPKYLNKENGRFITKFPKQALSTLEFKKTGKIHLSKSNITINTKINDFDLIKEVRIIPRKGYYVIEIAYEKLEENLKSDNNKYLSIDLGLNNLATCTSNIDNFKPFIINGKPLKSINHYYNRRRGDLQSKLEKLNKRKTSNRLNKLTQKRNNKIDDYLHKSSRYLVNQLVSNKINTLVVGQNKGWKQDINIGKVNNQKFVQIPHSKFINILKYKCQLVGINLITHEESYTSKCSFFDNEPIKKHDIYLGKRIKRGLFKTAKGLLINADVNGSYNILKKAVPNVFSDGIQGVGVHPLVITIK